MPLTRVRSQLISVPSNYPITGSLSGTASYATTASFAMNGGSGGDGTLQTGSIANQTILYNVTTSQDNIISGLNLSSNKWGVTVVEEWNSASIAGDTYYPSCSLLMHFSGSDGSTTFTDNSVNNLTVSSNNGAKITSSIYKFGNSSAFFDGTNDYLSSANNSAFNLSSGDFTVEFWFRTATLSLPASHGVLVGQMSYTSAGWGIWQYSNTTIYVYIGTGFAIQTPSVFTSTSTWYHIALVKNGTGTNSLKLYVDGVVQAQGDYTPTYASSYPLVIGGVTTSTGWNNNFYCNGYMDELRITKGIARYTGSFTPPTSAFLDNTSTTQLQTKYIGLVGGLNDSTVDYGVEKLSDISLKIRKMSASGQPLSGSGQLSSSVDRVYVNVLNYDNVSISGSINNAITSSYALTSSYTSGVGSINGTQLAKAWVNFDGTGTVTIRDSYNVSSITDNGVGDYTVNYSTALNNSNYCANASVRNFGIFTAAGGTITTSSIKVNTYSITGTITDSTHVFLSIFSN